MKIHLLTLALSLLVFWGAWGQSLEWAKAMGGTSSDYGLSMALDDSGNVYITGYFIGTVDFDPSASTFNLTSAGSMDIFISKLDPTGNFLWAKRMGGTSGDSGNSISLDASGNIYTTGYFSGTADLDPGAGTFNFTAAGNWDIFISKLDPSGNFLWAKAMGGTLPDFGQSIALDSSGNVYTTGYFQGIVDLNPGAGYFNLTSAGYFDIFVSKLDPSGNFLWAKRMGSTLNDHGMSIALDASGNAYTTGYFEGTVDFDPGAGTFNLTPGFNDIFISKLDPSGNFLWAKAIGGNLDDYGYSIALDASGNAYTTGYFNGTADFDPGAGTFNLTSAGSNDIFISKLDPWGNFLWAKAMGGTLYDRGYSIALDASGNAYTAGYFQGTVDFDPGSDTFNLTSVGSYDIFISKLDPSGNFLWAKVMGGTSDDYGFSIALDASANVYTTGCFNGKVDFDPGAGTFNLTSAISTDIFILKLKQQRVTGCIFNDLNQNCQRDSLEIGIQNRYVTINPGNIIAQTNESGVWVTDSLPIGTYTTTLDTSGNWSPTCPVTQTFTVTNPNEITYVPDFGLVSTQPCASPDVSINMPIVRRCFSNQKIYVNACNQNIATGVLSSAYADVELDSLIIPQSASLAYTSLGNNSYRFQLGTLNPGQCVNFTIDCQVSCDAMLGQTLCLEANLFPADSCVFDTIPEPYPGDFTPCTLPWDKSSISVKGWCKNDSIYFSVCNSGDDMDCYSPVRVYIDGVYTILDSVQLTAGTCFFYTFAGDGRTWRLEADQHPLYPGNSHPNATVEACGNLANWTSDLVNILPQDDADPIVDIYCGLVTGSYDPNDKTGYPTGVTSSNYIYPNQQLQYTIRFQNTGTDTAFTVVVRDTLDMDLDIFSVSQGVASHNYNFQMYGPKVLEWTFYNIQLPDSNSNEAGSHGFCTFTVNQNPDLANNTEIRNSADIYFDYNAPVITNQTLHTVYEFRQTLTITDTVYVNDTVCDSYIYNGFAYNNTGTYYQTNNDTLIILNLTIKDSTVLNLSIISCADYELNGIFYDSTGTYQQILVNSAGCDSIINLNLTIPPKYNVDTNIAICEGDSLIIGSQILKTAGVYDDSLLTVFGCDSIVSINLTVNPVYTINEEINICQGENYMLADSSVVNTSNVYTVTLSTITGCDSTIVTNLIVNPAYENSETVSICEGENYTLVDGTVVDSTNTYTINYNSINGCDSSFVTNLIILPKYITDTTVTICEGDSIIWNLQILSTAGTYSDTLISVLGCDSIVSINLIVNPTPLTSISIINPTCFGLSNGTVEVIVSGGTPAFSYNWSNGQSTAQIINLFVGIYYLTVTDNNGCFVIDSATINQPSEIIPEITVGNVTCYGGSDGYCTISSSGGTAPYSYHWSNGINNDVISNLTAGTYYVTITDANNCTVSDTAIITQPSQIFVSGSVTNSTGSNGAINISIINGISPYTFSWSNAAVTEDISGLAIGYYSVTVTDSTGCTRSSAFTVNFDCTSLNVNLTATNCTSNQISDGSITSTVSGGTTPYTYSWSNGSNYTNIENVSVGQYCITVTDFNNCQKIKCANINTDTIYGNFYVNSSTTVEVCISANHTFVSDLGFYLLAPGFGQEQLNDTVTGQAGIVELLPAVSNWSTVTQLPTSYVSCDPYPNGINTNCNSGNNVNNFCFKSTLPFGNPIYTACVCDLPTPLTGSYASAGPWTTVYGFPIDVGGWSVMITDCEQMDDGEYTEITLKFTQGTNQYNYDSGNISIPISDEICISNITNIYTFTLIPLSINQPSIESKNILIYPNPTDGKFYISIEGLRNDGNVDIIDVTGKLVFTEILTKETKLKQVDLSNLPKGIYAVKVTTGDVVKVSRIVVQ